jgi:Fe-S-cluster-containing hydrogenase component 2
MSERKPIFYINDQKCRNSYSCVRVCPVNAIEVRALKPHPTIVPGRCIGCGLCFIACSPHAIEYRDSRKEVKMMLASERKTVALVAPSIASEFDDITDYRKFVGMLRLLRTLPQI